MTSLQPPSFFQGTLKNQRKAEADDGTSPSGELGSLRQQNAALKEELEASRKAMLKPDSDSLSLPHQLPGLLTPAGIRLPPLTSDLLHVEACLQSRVKLLEEEKKHMASNILQLEKDLFEQKMRFSKEKETVLEEHKNTINKLQCDLRDLVAEYQGYRGNIAAQMEEQDVRLQRTQRQASEHVQELQEKLAQVKQDYNTLQLERCGEEQRLNGEVSELKKQLELREEAAAKKMAKCLTNIESLEGRVRSGVEKVGQLEAYLGGDIPQLTSGRTWTEEREVMTCQIQKLLRENQKLVSEDKLLNIRLSSISEILSIQEEDITKKCGGEDGRAFRSLLTQWRNKVFALLVQRKLQDIEVAREQQEWRHKGAACREELEEHERNCQLLSSALSDKSAQLQLQEARVEEVGKSLGEAQEDVQQLEQRLQAEQTCRGVMRAKMEALVHVTSQFKSVFHRSMTQLVNYDQRLALLSGHVQSISAALECRQVIYSTVRGPMLDAGCQVPTAGAEFHQGMGVVSLTQDQLENEMVTLRLERDRLVTQLRDSSRVFREQLDKGVSERECLSRHLEELEQQSSSLQASLEETQHELEESNKCRQESTERISQLEESLSQVESKAEAKLETELGACRERSRAELGEMEKLLVVARREHSKAVMDVQQLTRQLARDKEKSLEVHHLDTQRLQQQLLDTQKKLQATMVEKNLLLATLRDQGISLPKKSRLFHPTCSDLPMQLDDKDVAKSTPSPPPKCKEAEEGNGHDGQESIVDVLRDLQMLSASLLGLEKDHLEDQTAASSKCVPETADENHYS